VSWQISYKLKADYLGEHHGDLLTKHD
jgi:hypothetical protein